MFKEGKYTYHCDLCMCPIEQWEPLKTYNSDRTCEIYSDFSEIIWKLEEKPKPYSYKDVLNKCLEFKGAYNDIPDFEITVKEMIEIGLDTGIMSKLYRQLSIVTN